MSGEIEETRIPIIKLHDDLIVSIQVELSDNLVLRLKDDITAKIESSGARGLVIDLTGIALMDSYISRSIRDISLIARLMGVETVISGMSPVIAMTLVEMGMDMSDLRAALNLEAALELLAELHREEEEDFEPIYEVLVEASELELDGGTEGDDGRR